MTGTKNLGGIMTMNYKKGTPREAVPLTLGFIAFLIVMGLLQTFIDGGAI